MTLGFVFTTPPFGSAAGREGLDAVLAASNYTDNIALFFVGDGVMQLLSDQDPTALLCRDHIKTFKMLPLCEVEKIYLCQDSLAERALTEKSFVLEVKLLSAEAIAKKLAACSKILCF